MRIGRFRVDRTTAFIAVGALLLGAVYMGIAAWVDAQFADTVPSTSSLSTSSLGLKVWREYLDRLGMGPRLLTQFDSLPASSTIVLAGSFEKPPTGDEAARLAEWVRAGGRAVLVGMDDGGISAAFEPPGGNVSGDLTSAVSPSFPGAYASNVRTIAAGSARFEVAPGAWVTLFSDGQGASLITRTYGRGSVVWLADVTAVSNDGIGLRDGARLAVHLANAGRPVYFDEYHHGITSRVTAWGLIGAGGRAAIVLLLAGALAYLLARGRRLGPTIAAHDVVEARGTAHIAQLAELFRSAGARAEALARMEEGVVHALVRRYGDRAAGLSRQPGAAKALGAAAALRQRGRIGKDEFVAAARELRAARKEVEG